MSKVAFVTYRDVPGLTPDDRLAADTLRRRGVDVEAVVWDAPDVSWEEFDLVILRSCWEYHLRTGEFSGWVARMEDRGVALWNPPRVVQWNTDKSYLRDLAAEGVNIPPTVWLDRDSDINLTEILEANGWTEAVVKPTVSMSAFQTSVVPLSHSTSGEAAAREILKRSGAMIQKFVPEVRTRGEWSFVFFGKAYSHAVLKRPKGGDFRVQTDFGGSVEDVTPPRALVAQAERVLGLIEETLLYARVDAIDVNGALVLMELELIDPVLFFGSDPLSPARFTDMVMSVMRTNHRSGSNRESIAASRPLIGPLAKHHEPT